MAPPIRIGLVGDHDAAVVAHRAIPCAIALAAQALGVDPRHEWVPTAEIEDASRVAGYDGLWCVPASPYRSMHGALRAIRHARERGVPFLGTCGGFQHAIVEYARNVLRWTDADHAETAPESPRAVIAPLACALVEVAGTIRLRESSRLAAAYGCAEITEQYHCGYGLNAAHASVLTVGALQIVGVDPAGAVRAVELDAHPFFVATLFQPERAALSGTAPPIVRAFLEAAASSRERP